MFKKNEKYGRDPFEKHYCMLCTKEYIRCTTLKNWQYKVGNKVFCSYSCYSKYLNSNKNSELRKIIKSRC